MNHISPPDIAQSDLMEAYTNKINIMYPQGTFHDKLENSNAYSWVDASKIITEYEPILMFDLLEFSRVCNTNINKNENENISSMLISTFESKLKNVNLEFEFERARTFPLNIRGPQKESTLVEKYDLEYYNILGSLYCICISEIPAGNIQNVKKTTNTPMILIDRLNTSMYIQWTRNNKESMIYLPLAPPKKKLRHENAKRLQEQTEKALVTCINGPKNVVDFALILEIVCLALVELYVPNNVATKIIRIICDSSTEAENSNVRDFEIEILGIINTVKAIDKSRFLKLYRYRYSLSLLRGAIACSESARLKKLRKVFGIVENPAIGHRNHGIVKEISNIIQRNYRGEKPLWDEIGTLESLKDGSQDPKEISYCEPSEFNNLLLSMVLGMSPNDIAFTYRGFNIRVDQVRALASPASKHTLPFKTAMEAYFCEDVVDRINKHSENKHNIRVYTQLQVDAMVMMPHKFKACEYRNLFDFLYKQGNTVYVIFEDKSRGTEDHEERYLVHGFQLRFYPEKVGDIVELVVLVPKACIFRVLEPITWRFLSLLDGLFKEKFPKENSPLITKEPMYNLSKYVYDNKLDKIYVSRNTSLIQVELIANNRTDLEITNHGEINWKNLQ